MIFRAAYGHKKSFSRSLLPEKLDCHLDRVDDLEPVVGAHLVF